MAFERQTRGVSQRAAMPPATRPFSNKPARLAASNVSILTAPITNWRLLTPIETPAIFGRGNPFMFTDQSNVPYDDCPPPPGSSDSGGTGNGSNGPNRPVRNPNDINEPPGPVGRHGLEVSILGQAGAGTDCAGCGGMPVWQVDECFINLWLDDEPLGYQPALGDWVSFHLAYKQRDEDSNLDPSVYSLGSSWKAAILSYVYSQTDFRYGPLGATVHFPGGGEDNFQFNNGVATSYYNNNTLQAITNANNVVTGYQLTRPNGSKYIYSFFRTDSSGGWYYVYLTQILDPKGYTTTFNYAPYDSDTQVVRLSSITDPY